MCVNVFHGYILLGSNYFLAVPITKIFWPLTMLFLTHQSLVKFSVIKSYSGDTVKRRLSSHSHSEGWEMQN